MASGNLYEVTTYGKFGGQDIINVYHYLQTAGTGDADICALAFVNDVMGFIQGVQTTGFSWTAVTAKDKADPTDFATEALMTTGDNIDSSLPMHLTWSMTYISNRLDARSGGKRISGLGESMIASGIATGAFIARLAGLEAVLESPITQDSNSWRPVIYGKRTGQTGYYSNPLSAVRYLGITSQNSRKFYTSPGL